MFLEQCHTARLISVLSYNSRNKTSEVKGRPYHALSYRVRGGSKFTAGSQELSVDAGQILYMPAGLDYRHHSGQDEVMVLHFTMENGSESMEVFDAGEPIFYDLFCSVVRLWQQKQPGYELAAMSAFYKLLYQMHLHFSPDLSGTALHRLRPALRHIHEHLSDPDLSVPDLCALAGVSDTYFRELFLQVFGTTPLQYINARRVDRACDLLTMGEMRVEETAEVCGFSDAKYFATVFKKYKGCPPSKYKK